MSKSLYDEFVRDTFEFRLDARIRLAAKLLSRNFADVPRSKALTALARAGGHGSWRELSAELEEESHRIFGPLATWVPAILARLGEHPLGFTEGLAAPFSEKQLAAAEAYWRDVARGLKADETATLDSVAARLFGADSWTELVSRPPRPAIESLYSFVLKKNGNGNFIASRLAVKLNGAIGQVFFESSRFDAAETEREAARETACRKHVIEHPGFIEGAYLLAEILADASPAEAEHVLAENLEQLDALIPPAFLGRILFRDGDSFYLKMKWLLFSLQIKTGKIKEACLTSKAAERELDGDDLGFRSCAPMAYLTAGNIPAAKRLLGKTIQYADSLSTVAFSAACAEYLEGNIAKFREYLFLALGSSHAIREFIDNPDDYAASTSSMRWHPSEWTVLFRCCTALFEKVPGLRRAVGDFLHEPEVQDALRHVEMQMSPDDLPMPTNFNEMLSHAGVVSDRLRNTTVAYAKQFSA